MRATVAIILFATLLIAFRGFAAAQTPDSVPQWEVTITGMSSGFGVMSFASNGDMFGYLIVTPAMKKTAQPAPQTLMGFTFITGEWSLDAGGRMSGFFSGDARVPLDISFQGKVKVGSSTTIAIAATGNAGSWHMSGIPVSIPAVNGFDGTIWSASVLKNSIGPFIEIFDLTDAVCLDDPPPTHQNDCQVSQSYLNLFGLWGQGPGYALRGYLMVGTRGKIGIAVEELDIDKDAPPPDNVAATGVLRTVIGKLSLKKGVAKVVLLGLDEDADTVKMTATASP